MSSPKTLKILGGVLAVQALLAAFTWLPGSGGPPEAVSLVGLDRDAITRITVLGSPDDDEPLVLTRNDGAWEIASIGGFPAKPDKIAEVLDTLTGLQGGRPIATRATSHPSLEVADDAFGRKVVLSDGTSEETLYLGAASGKAVNVRPGDGDDVYLVRGVSLWSVSDTPRSYYDTTLLSLDEDAIGGFTVANAHGTVVLSREGGGWTLDGAPEGAPLDTGEIDRLLGRIATIRMTEPVGTDLLPEYGLDGGTRIEWVVEGDDGSETGGLTLGAKDGASRYLRLDDDPFVVKVSDGLYASFVDLTAEDLLGTEG